MACQDPAAELQSTVLPGVQAIPNKGQNDLKQLMTAVESQGTARQSCGPRRKAVAGQAR